MNESVALPSRVQVPCSWAGGAAVKGRRLLSRQSLLGGWNDQAHWPEKVQPNFCGLIARGSTILFLLLSHQFGRAQGTVVFHNTGGGQPIVSEVRSVFLDAALQQPSLVFNFGFATDEAPTPGSFL